MRSTDRSFCNRITGPDFLLKLLALIGATSITYLWKTETEHYNKLPAKNYFEFDLYFHTLNGFVFVLAGMIILYILGEIPKLMVQRVVLLYGTGLFIVCGVVGLINYLYAMPGLQNRMLIISLIFFIPAILMSIDYLYQEEWFKNAPDSDDESDASSASGSYGKPKTP